MKKIEQLFANNYKWATQMKEEKSTYFQLRAGRVICSS